jgi:hypothetical protein
LLTLPLALPPSLTIASSMPLRIEAFHRPGDHDALAGQRQVGRVAL